HLLVINRTEDLDNLLPKLAGCHSVGVILWIPPLRRPAAPRATYARPASRISHAPETPEPQRTPPACRGPSARVDLWLGVRETSPAESRPRQRFCPSRPRSSKTPRQSKLRTRLPGTSPCRSRRRVPSERPCTDPRTAGCRP